MFQKIRRLLSKCKRRLVCASNFFFCDHEKLMHDVADIKYCQELIMDYVFDVRNVKEATGALREFQLQDVELFKILKEICDNNAIDYFNPNSSGHYFRCLYGPILVAIYY